MKIKLLKKRDDLIFPVRAHYNDAGLDCFAQEDFTIMPMDDMYSQFFDTLPHVRLVELGFGLEIPDGYTATLRPRSSMNQKGIITQIGTIDSGYRGEIKAVFVNCSCKKQTFKRGDKICQLVFEPITIVDPVLELGEERGEGGFGSTDLSSKFNHASYTLHEGVIHTNDSSPDMTPDEAARYVEAINDVYGK